METRRQSDGRGRSDEATSAQILHPAQRLERSWIINHLAQIGLGGLGLGPQSARTTRAAVPPQARAAIRIQRERRSDRGTTADRILGTSASARRCASGTLRAEVGAALTRARPTAPAEEPAGLAARANAQWRGNHPDIDSGPPRLMLTETNRQSPDNGRKPDQIHAKTSQQSDNISSNKHQTLLLLADQKHLGDIQHIERTDRTTGILFQGAGITLIQTSPRWAQKSLAHKSARQNDRRQN